MSMTRRTFLKLGGAAALGASALARTLSAGEASARALNIPVLLYHNLSNEVHDDFTLSPSSFAAQMEWLYANGYRALAMNEGAGFLSGNTGQAIMITFDDGYTSFMDFAFPFLRAYGFKATLNVIGKVVDDHALFGRKPMVSWDECRYLVESGLVEIGCHSYGLHTVGGVLAASYPQIESDLNRFQETFKREIGKACTTIAWPYGIYDAICIDIARRTGFRYMLTSREGYVDRKTLTDPFPRLNINDRLDLISFQQYIGAIP